MSDKRDYYQVLEVPRDADEKSIKRAYRTLYRSGLGLEEAKRELAGQAAQCAEVGALLEFLARSRRGFIH